LSASARRIAVGRVGKPHGRDGSFYVDAASHPLPEGFAVTVGGQEASIERRAGSAERPLVRLSGISARERATELRGEPLLADLSQAPLESGEWLVEDLVGCEVPGLGEVRQVVQAPSCDLLEVGSDGVLVPFISDAVRHIDVAARRIEVDRAFLGLDEPAEQP
jgi:16S rRNA processing protein RimM